LLKIDTEPANRNWNGFIAKHCRFLNTTGKFIRPASDIFKNLNYEGSPMAQKRFKELKWSLNEFLKEQTDDDVNKYKLAWKNILKTFPSMLEYTSLKNNKDFVMWYLNTVEQVQPASTFMSFYNSIPEELKNNYKFANTYMLKHPSVALYFLQPWNKDRRFILEHSPSTTSIFYLRAGGKEIVQITFKRQEDGEKQLIVKAYVNTVADAVDLGPMIMQYEYTSEESGFLLDVMKIFDGPVDEERLVSRIYVDDKKRSTQTFEGEKGHEKLVKTVVKFKRGSIATVIYDFEVSDKTTISRNGRRKKERLTWMDKYDNGLL
jgi:hypothetical protein